MSITLAPFSASLGAQILETSAPAEKNAKSIFFSIKFFNEIISYEFPQATKEGISSVSDEVCLKLIAKLVKQRKDAADIFLQQDRKDLAQDEMNQLAFLQLYLPVQMEENEVREIVKEVIAKTSASSSADIGKCMGILMRRLNGKADGTLISRLVRELLS